MSNERLNILGSTSLMPRYVKQKTLSDCGPVAVLNVLKWCGWKLTYKNHIKHIKEECEYTNDEDFVGVRWWKIRDALVRITRERISVRKQEVKNLQLLKGHVSKGGAFILRYRTTARDIHYSTILPSNVCENFVWLNPSPRTVKIIISPEIFEREVMKNQNFGDPLIALLIKKN